MQIPGEPQSAAAFRRGAGGPVRFRRLRSQRGEGPEHAAAAEELRGAFHGDPARGGRQHLPPAGTEPDLRSQLPEPQAVPQVIRKPEVQKMYEKHADRRDKARIS